MGDPPRRLPRRSFPRRLRGSPAGATVGALSAGGSGRASAVASAGRRIFTVERRDTAPRRTLSAHALRSHGASVVRPALRSPAHVALTGRVMLVPLPLPSRQLRESRTSGRTCQRTGATRASVPGASCGSRSPALGTQPSPSNRAPVWSHSGTRRAYAAASANKTDCPHCAGRDRPSEGKSDCVRLHGRLDNECCLHTRNDTGVLGTRGTRHTAS